MKRLAVAHITGRCNHRCVFCLEGDLNRRGENDPSTDDVTRTMSELRTEGADSIIFMGGETLLRPDLIAIVRAARELGYVHVMVATNGTPLARPGYLRELVGAGLDRVEISVEADTPELAHSISGARATHERQVRALEAIDETGIATTVNLVVCRENRERLVSILRFVREHVRRAPLDVKLKFVSLQGRALSAVKASGAAISYRDVDVAGICREADALSVPITFYDFPLCQLAEGRTRSLELRDLCSQQQYFDHDHDSGAYFDSGYQLSRGIWPREPCGRCSLRPLCPGVDATHFELHGPAELEASSDDPVALVEATLSELGEDTARAHSLVDAARKLHRPDSIAAHRGRPETLLFECSGEPQAVGLEVGARADDSKAFAKSSRFVLSYTTWGGPSALELAGVEQLLRAAVDAMQRADTEGAPLPAARDAVARVTAAGWRSSVSS